MSLGAGQLRGEAALVVPAVFAGAKNINTLQTIGSIVGFLMGGARPGATALAIGDPGALALQGIVEYPMHSGDTDAAGTLFYFDAAANELTTTSSGNKKAGYSLFGSIPWTPLTGNIVIALTQLN